MNDKQLYVSFGLLIIYLVLSFLALKRIVTSKQLERTQKNMNIIMIVVLPFLWSLFILIFFSQPKKRKDDGYVYRDAGFSNYTKWGG